MKKSSYSIGGLLVCLIQGPLLAAPPPATPPADAVQLPPVVVTGRTSSLKEDAPSGAYGQPDWVKSRRFSTTRVHIQRDPWEMAVEQWWRGRFYDGGESKHRFQTEFEIGLPYRMQVDLYENFTYADGDWDHENFAAELRWALADWDVIPLNPTLYFEYKFGGDGPDVIEPKLLLGGDFGEGWHWGLNFIYEAELSGEETREWAVATGISKTLIDEKLSVGLEAKYVYETVEGDRDNGEHKLVAGPSVQWRPTRNSHIDLVTLGGLTEDSPNAEIWFIIGFDFGGSESRGGYKPTNLKSN